MASQPDPEAQIKPEHADALPGSTSAKIIDFATRSMIRATQRRQSGDRPAWGAGMVIVALLGAITYWMANFQAEPQKSIGAAQTTGQEAAFALPDFPILSGIEGGLPEVPLESPEELTAPPLSPVLANPPEAIETPLPAGNPHASPIIVFDGGDGTASDIMVLDSVQTGGSEGGASRNADATARTGSLKGRTLAKGTLISAILETPIDTAQPGFVRAIVSSDVRSSDGKRVLVPRSSRLIGQYVSDSSAAQKRTTIVWSRLTRPDGEAVAIGGSGGIRATAGAALTSVIAGQSSSAVPGSAIRVRQGEPVRILAVLDIEL